MADDLIARQKLEQIAQLKIQAEQLKAEMQKVEERIQRLQEPTR